MPRGRVPHVRPRPRGSGVTSYVLVVGATDLAVEHAVWDLLYRLGHRQFFPGATWEVIPKSAILHVEVDVREHPSYYARRLWYGYGPWAGRGGYVEEEEVGGPPPAGPPY